MPEPWTLEELVAEVAAELARAGVGQGSSRVRDTPDLRTARYYTSLGLLDGPAEFRGKVGLYRDRQRLQLLAVKRLQAQGESLSTIQSKLLGLSTKRLRAFAEPALAPPAPLAPATSFLASPPPTPPTPADEAPAAPVDTARPAAAPAALHAVALADPVTLLLKARRALTPDDLEAITVAAAPLLRLLRARLLVD